MQKLVIVVIALALTSCTASVRPLPTARHAETQWIVRDSLAFEAIAFLNALSGDPLVGAHYLADTRHFRSLLTPEVEQALADLATFREEKRHGDLSGFLLSFFLAGGANSLDDLIALTEEPAPIRKALQDYDRSLVEINVYYGDPGWQMFEETLPSLKIVFKFLEEVGFAGYWESHHRAHVAGEIERVQAAVSGYNNWPDYVAEDSVRALEQLIEGDLGLGKRWNWTDDGGMHALSVVLYELMRQEGFPHQGEGYQDFVIRMVKEGKLAPGATERLYQAQSN